MRPPLRTIRARGSAAKGESARRSLTISKSPRRGAGRCRDRGPGHDLRNIRGRWRRTRHGHQFARIHPPSARCILTSDSLGIPMHALETARKIHVMWWPPIAIRWQCTKRPPNRVASWWCRRPISTTAAPRSASVVGQHRQARHIGAGRHGFDVEMTALDHQHQVLGDRRIRRDDVHVDAELPRHHAARIANALDASERVADRQRMQTGATLAGCGACRCR